MSTIILRAQEIPEGLERHAYSVMRDQPAPDDMRLLQDLTLGDELIVYRLNVRPSFERLRDALSQMAAILLLIASGSRDAIAHPMLAFVEASTGEVREALSVLKVPLAARHGHAHLLASLSMLEGTLPGVRSVCASDVIESVYGSLQRSLRELRFAAGQVPGLEIVSGAQACACHALAERTE